MNRVFLVLGGNLGDRLRNLRLALEGIEDKLGAIAQKSSIYETKAWGKTDQPDFLNMVVEVTTACSPEGVLDVIQKIETDLGRIRIEKWSSRTMDIDVLFYNDEILNLKRLNIPHLLMDKRKFVLLPLAEIAETFVHPYLKKQIKQLLLECDDTLDVLKLDKTLQ